mgnify:CR=1 FL=1
MPEGEEVREEQIVSILDPKFQEEIDMKMTKAEALFIFRFLEQNIQPRGMQMVEFAYNLMKRFDVVKDIMSDQDMARDAGPEPVTTEEVPVSTFVAEEKPPAGSTGKVYKDNVLQE